MKQISTSGVYQLTIGTDAGKSVIIVSVRDKYKGKPVYSRILEKEYNQWKDFDSPGVFRYLALRDNEDGSKSLIMDWEESIPLADYLKEQHSEDERETVFEDVATAVGSIHAVGKIHGQLAPDVIFVTAKGGRGKVLNFRQRYVDTLMEPRDVTRYQSPEAKDNTTQLTATTDIYSLGVLLRYLGLSDSHPSVVECCCNPTRSSRYPSTEDLIYALHHRVPASSHSEIKLPHINRRALVTLAVAVVVIVIGVALYSNWDSFNFGSLSQGNDADTVNVSAVDQKPAQADTAKSDTAVMDTTSYTGDLQFLATLVPQMHTDIDKIYAKAANPQQARRRVKGYYKGLRRTLHGLNQQQYAAFDKAFADYVNVKNGQQK